MPLDFEERFLPLEERVQSVGSRLFQNGHRRQKFGVPLGYSRHDRLACLGTEEEGCQVVRDRRLVEGGSDLSQVRTGDGKERMLRHGEEGSFQGIDLVRRVFNRHIQ